MAKKDENKKVVFRRIRGRIVPIAVGGAIAAEAASRKTALKAGKTEITSRKIPFVNPKGRKGQRFKVFNVLSAREKKKGILGKLGFTRSKGFSVFSVERGGVDLPSIYAEDSRTGALLFKETAKQGKAQGAKRVRGRVLQNPDLVESISKRGGKFFSFTEKRGRNIRISKSTAKRLAAQSAKAQSGGAAVSSVQKIPKSLKSGKLFRTRANKLQIAGGLALAGAGAIGVFSRRKKRGSKKD